jgi:hypothetical protein
VHVPALHPQAAPQLQVFAPQVAHVQLLVSLMSFAVFVMVRSSRENE